VLIPAICLEKLGSGGRLFPIWICRQPIKRVEKSVGSIELLNHSRLIKAKSNPYLWSPSMVPVGKTFHHVWLKHLSVVTLFAVLGTLVGCSANLLSEVQVSGQTQPTNDLPRGAFVGRWELEVPESIKRTVTANKGNRIIPATELQRTFQFSFECMRMSFDFKDDGTYTCHHKTAFSEGDFPGTWSVKGDTLIVQENDSGEKMFGRFQGKLLQIDNPESDGELISIYMLQRAN
jgi:hypothetical protein